MIRPYCGECGQEMTTCECPEYERIPLLNMTQKDFDRSITEAYRRGLDVMGERVSDLKVAIQVTARHSYQEGYAVGCIDGETSMRERAADLCAEAINAVRPTGRWDPEVRGAQNEAERLEQRIRDLEVEP